jgi:hypothetical protein
MPMDRLHGSHNGQAFPRGSLTVFIIGCALQIGQDRARSEQRATEEENPSERSRLPSHRQCEPVLCRGSHLHGLSSKSEVPLTN